MLENESLSGSEPEYIYLWQTPHPNHSKSKWNNDVIAIIITFVLSVLLVAIMYFYYRHKWIKSPLKYSIKRTWYRWIIIYLIVSLILFILSLYVNHHIYGNPL